MLCTDKETGIKYAAKVLSKARVVKEGKMKYVTSERNLLNMVSHEGIIKFAFSFTDEQRLYILLELAPNGMLLEYMQQPLSVEATAFYTAEIILALEHMHGKGIVHRDLKPENVLLSGQMHVKVTDFGTAKLLGAGPATTPSGKVIEERKNSFPGSEEYVSPELLGEADVTQASDLWALGVMVFQMLTGKVPFKGATQFLTFQKIQSGEVEFPADFPPKARDLVSKLLVLSPIDRLGADPSKGGYQALKDHPFFEGIHWDKIFETTPPELPVRRKID